MLTPSQKRYLVEVLGVQAVLTPENSILASQEVTKGRSEPLRGEPSGRYRFVEGQPGCPYFFLIEKKPYEFQDSPESQMLQRILSALKLSDDKVAIVEFNSTPTSDDLAEYLHQWRARTVAGFFSQSSELHQQLEIEETKIVFTHSLSDLLTQASLKKSTWESLQSLMKRVHS